MEHRPLTNSGPDLGPLLLNSMPLRPLYPDSTLNLIVPDTSDVESDVLLSDDSDAAASSEEEVEDGGEDPESEGDFFSDELYSSFIQSVFASAEDDNDKHSLCSGTDEDDEEYRPQSAVGSVGEPENEDDDDDVDINTITPRELKQLVNHSWRTVTSQGKTTNAVTFHPISEPANVGAVQGVHAPSRSDDPLSRVQSNRDKNLMSAMLDKLLSGEQADGICVDGIQVDTLRRLVARQMSMCLQVLVEILLLCDNRSPCDNECFRCLMELGTYRGASVRKVELMKLQTRNIYKLTKRRTDENADYSSLNNNKSTIKFEDTDSEDETVGFHLTRSHTAAAAETRQPDSEGRSVSSVFDMPALADIKSLLVAIDDGRKMAASVDATSPTSGLTPGGLTSSATPRALSMHPPMSQQQQWVNLLGQLSGKLQSVLGRWKSRIWQCLIPRLDYPCRGAVSGVVGDPSSLLSRSVFTSAEDDLLLRGLIHVGHVPGSMTSSDTVWAIIHEKFLPSKDKQLLEFRYTQLLNSAGPEGDRFKKCAKLMKDRGKAAPKWSLEEDIDLLKGFQVYGDKWHMINLYFLPHRSRRELKSRWGALLKDSSKTFSNRSDIFSQNDSVDSNMIYFLVDLKTRGAQADTSTSTVSVGTTGPRNFDATGGGETLRGYKFQYHGGCEASTTKNGQITGNLIMKSLREADDDVLVDTESDDSLDVGPHERLNRNDDKSKHFDHLVVGDTYNDSSNDWQLGNSLSDALLKRNMLQNSRCSATSIAFSDSSTPNIPGSPKQDFMLRDLSERSPRFVETSIGAFNFTVPHLGETASPNFDFQSRKRDFSESGCGLHKRSKARKTEVHESAIEPASLFERVVISPSSLCLSSKKGNSK